MEKLFVLAMVLFPIGLTAQSTLFNHNVISASGKSLKSDSYELNFTLGEFLIETFNSSDGILSQGFHQNIISISTSTSPSLNLIDILAISPNPTKGNLNLSSRSQKLVAIEVRLYDVTGRQLFKEHHRLGQEKVELDLSKLSRGPYFLEVVNVGKWSRQIFKIIKL